MIQRPHLILRSPALWMVWAVYGSTYTAANLIDVAAERRAATPTQHSTAKLAGTTAVNMSASIAKDVAFARMFGNESAQAVKKAVPMGVYGVFFLRDVATMGSSFVLPPVVASGLQTCTGMEGKTADKVAQLVTPVGAQLICAPLHLLGLNIYNAPVATLRERAAGVWRTCPETTFVRMGRILCAYGFGGIVNKELTSRGRAWTVERYGAASKKSCQSPAGPSRKPIISELGLPGCPIPTFGQPSHCEVRSSQM
jgi:hypothetical protein